MLRVYPLVLVPMVEPAVAEGDGRDGDGVRTTNAVADHRIGKRCGAGVVVNPDIIITGREGVAHSDGENLAITVDGSGVV